MRNTLQYPVTKDEIVKILDDLHDSFDSNLIGDIRPLAVRKLRRFVLETMPDALYDDIDPRSGKC